MKQKKVNGVLKSAFAFGAALGGAGMITDMDVVYAEELEEELKEIGRASCRERVSA